MHDDAAGVPRVAFVMNPTPADLNVRVAIEGATALIDLLPRSTRGAARHAVDEARITRVAGSFEVSVPARTVRMLTVEA